MKAILTVSRGISILALNDLAIISTALNSIHRPARILLKIKRFSCRFARADCDDVVPRDPFAYFPQRQSVLLLRVRLIETWLGSTAKPHIHTYAPFTKVCCDAPASCECLRVLLNIYCVYMFRSVSAFFFDRFALQFHVRSLRQSATE